jgi:hypothetical protein
MKRFALLTAAFAFVVVASTNATAQTTTENSTLSEASKATPAATKTEATKKVLTEQEIVAQYLTVTEMPADFPKRVENGSEERYRSLVKMWMKENTHLVKAEYLEKMNKTK